MSFVLGMYHFLKAVSTSCNKSRQKYTNQTRTLRVITRTFLLAAMPAALTLISGVGTTECWEEQESDWHNPGPFWPSFLSQATSLVPFLPNLYLLPKETSIQERYRGAGASAEGGNEGGEGPRKQIL